MVLECFLSSFPTDLSTDHPFLRNTAGVIQCEIGMELGNGSYQCQQMELAEAGTGGEAAGSSLGIPGHLHGTVALPCCFCMGSDHLGFLEMNFW